METFAVRTVLNAMIITTLRLTRFLFGGAFLLILASIAHGAAKFIGPYDRTGFTSFLDADVETNVFVWFSSTVLLVCSALLWLIPLEASKAGSPLLPYWRGLCGVFLCLSLNKTAGVHRRVIDVLAGGPDARQNLYSVCLIAASLGAVLFGLIFLRFLRQLPLRTARLFIFAAATFGVGVLGVPHLVQFLAQTYSRDHIGFSLSVVLKESLEMTGAILFLHALLLYLSSRGLEIEVSVT